MTFQTVGVVGVGQMGSGIVEVVCAGRLPGGGARDQR